ncbi:MULTISPECIES: DeoR/GlpR family DNA-binding transcription regulator [unclassified Gemella]|uniref:DeoR/GlpR family DNA-binding transcription regulator n=1 Tax=unclassified Gemella TaxID=2624949 RepID=UPI001C05E3A0|nr:MULTISPECIES: DeoR/GlpR family DNA-binding transcription regulator [unclassified Gemella]MBU0279059.1 DeoR/GlpR family DNA-binding transcription regulator [Gemella sp. zg-1178]QWQ38774.1 DeoR/GlpR family DNA-binding transcription regulator [Gemella sp. zg-570]
MNERRRKILQLLEEKNIVSLQELVLVCDVSEATIRRDLSLLEEKNLIFRTHGGAAKKNSTRGLESNITSKKSEFTLDKKEVAKYVCENFIENGQTIYLDSGTSTYEMIDYLKNRNIKVITNSAYHLRKLLDNKIHTIILGGLIKHSTQAIIGMNAYEQLSKYSFDVCFIGCNGVDLDFGISTADENEAILKSLAIKNSKRKFILADISKFDHRKFYKFSNFDESTIVTYEAPEKYHNQYNIIKIKKEG